MLYVDQYQGKWACFFNGNLLAGTESETWNEAYQKKLEILKRKEK